MKSTTLLLAASLLANLALVALFATRSSGPDSNATANAARPAANAQAAGSSGSSTALQTALASGDVTALVAAGIAPENAREFALARKLSQFAAKARAAQAASAGDGKWWRARPGTTGAAREQQLASRRELSDALAALLGTDLGIGGGDASQLAFLPAAKRDALRRITQDYDEMMAKFATGDVQLASDREQLRLLRVERERDIAALLSPDEKLAYEMRTSASAAAVRNRYGDAIESEAEFQKIFALQKAFDDKFSREALTGRISPEVLTARSEADRKLDSDLRAALGDDRYAALRRASDPDLRNVDSLVTRLNLPASTTANIASARDTYAAESQRINNDANTPFPERRTQIQALAERAKADVTRALGTEAAEAYAQNSQWLSFLRGGMAYATTPQPGSPPSLGTSSQGVFPVMPAGATGPGTRARQVFVSGTPAIDGGVIGDRVISNSNVQVMTFSATHGDAPTAPAGGGATIVVPAQPLQPAQPVPTPKR